MLLAALFADAGDDGTLYSPDDMPSIVELLDRGDDSLDIRLGGVRFHYDNHVENPLRAKIRIAKTVRRGLHQDGTGEQSLVFSRVDDEPRANAESYRRA